MLLCLCNEKGGVAKTTSAIQIASLLADRKSKTLVLDIDPQGHCALGLGLRPVSGEATIFDVLVGHVSINQAIKELSGYLHILPATKKLAQSTSIIQGQPGADQVLAEVIKPIRQEYDYIIVDSPPNLGILTLNALAASDYVLIPIVPQLFPLQGFAKIKQTIALMKKRTNPKLEIVGVLPTLLEGTNIMGDVMNVLNQEFESDPEGILGSLFPAIPKSTKYAEAQAAGKPLQHYLGKKQDNSKLLAGYKAVVQELLELDRG